MVFNILLAIIALSPLPFGLVYQWGWAAFCAASGSLIVAWCLNNRQTYDKDINPKILRLILGYLLSILTWIAIQSTTTAPASWHFPLWAEAAELLGSDYHGSVSVDPAGSIKASTRILAYAGVFWLSLFYCRSAGNAKRALQIVSFSGAVYCAYGLAMQFGNLDYVLWKHKFAYVGDLTGTFINRNNFATYAGIAWISTLTLFFKSLYGWIREAPTKSEIFLSLLKFIEKKGWLHLLLMTIMSAALLYSHSRGGLAATIFGIAIFCLSLFVSSTFPKKIILSFCVGCIILSALFLISSGRVSEDRLASTHFEKEERARVFSLTSQAVGDRPILGTGLGTFEEVFRLYRSADIEEYYAQAHNTYLEDFLELGVPMTILVLLGPIGIFALNLYGVRKRRRDAYYPAMGLGISSLVGAHALVDFSIQIPAVAIVFWFLLGAASAQSWSSRQSAPWNTRAPSSRITTKQPT